MGAAKKKQEEEPEEQQQEFLFKENLFEDDEDPAGFENQLIALADNYNEHEYYKKFSPDEVGRFEKEIVETSVEIKDLELEKKLFNDEINSQLKQLKSNRDEATKSKKSGAVWTKETLYAIVEPNTGVIGYYDKRGVLQFTKIAKRGRGLQKTIPLITSKSEDEQ